MLSAGASSIIQKKYRPYTSKKEKIDDRENLLEQDFSTTTINEKWITDITFIHVLCEGWCYLASVFDLHSKKVIGYSFSSNMTTDIVVEVLENAYSTQGPSNELILYTDLGSYYTSQKFQCLLAELKIRASFSRKGCPYDNACMESFHASLKME